MRENLHSLGGRDRIPHKHFISVNAATHQELGAMLGRQLGEAVRALINEESQAPDWERRRRRAQPMLRATERHAIFTPYLDELDAFANAAGVPFEELWTYSLEHEVTDGEMRHLEPDSGTTEYPSETELSRPPERCTSMVANGGRLVAHSEDWELDSAHKLWVLRTCVGPSEGVRRTKLELHYAGTLGSNGASVVREGDRTTVQLINSLSHRNPNADGVPRHLVARFLGDSTDPQEALETLRPVKRSGGYAHTFVTQDPDGRHSILSAELSPNRMSAIHIQRAHFAHSNHHIHPAMADKNAGMIGSAESMGTTTRRRLAVASSNLHQFHQPRGRVAPEMPFAVALQILGNRLSDAWPGVRTEGTIGAFCVDLRAGIAGIHLAREELPPPEDRLEPGDDGWRAYELAKVLSPNFPNCNLASPMPYQEA